jgi:hypothetical protein
MEKTLMTFFVIASKAKQSMLQAQRVDCFVAFAPRNDEPREEELNALA